MNNFGGNFCNISFTPAVASCYLVHALNADAHTYLRRCYATLGASGTETSLLLTAYCIE